MLNFACIERLNFDEPRCICLFVTTTQIIIPSGSHRKMKDSPTLILVKGKRLSAGESSIAFNFARKSHRNEIKVIMAYIARDVQTVISRLKFAYCAGTHKALKSIVKVQSV